jgi:hypothetical protein
MDAMNILHSSFKYANSAESSKPNYLKNKFDRIRRELREQAEAEKAKPIATVRTLKTMKEKA